MANSNSSGVESVELLNKIKYNYGIFMSADLCNTLNRLAVCTDKCIFIINFNLNWPQTPPSKYLANFKKIIESSKHKTLSSSSSEFAKQSFNLDSWIQDLNENKNELVFLNLIRNIKQSDQVELLYKEYLNLEDVHKRKSFHRLIRDQINSNNLIESNLDQYLKVKHFIDQAKLFDSDLYDYLSFLNPITNPNQNSKTTNKTLFSNFYYGFKYCKWNSNSKLNLLCVVTSCNQLLLFDCTKLSNGNRDNLIDTTSNTYDKVTNSKYFNLTELWLTKYKNDLIKSKSSTIDQYLSKIKQIFPLTICWSKPTKLGELLFVAYKSNEVSVFLVNLNKENSLDIELASTVDLNEKCNSNSEEEEDESSVQNSMLNSTNKTHKISSLHFDDSSHILSIGYLSGDLILIKFDFKLTNERVVLLEKCFLKQTSLHLLNEIERLELIDWRANNKHLLVLKRENSLEFQIIKFENEKLTSESQLKCDVNRQDDTVTTNHVIKNHNKIVDFKLTQHESDVFKFMIWFESANIKHLILHLNEKTNELRVDTHVLMNNTIEIKFDTNSTLCNNNKTLNKHDCFKLNRCIFLSGNNYLLYQLNGFNKLELIERKITQIELNIYCLKPYDTLVNDLLPANELKSTNLNDLLWLFKRQLYLSRDYFNESLFQYLSALIKNVSPKLNDLKADESFEAYLKLARLIILILANYCETLTYFDYFDQQQQQSESESDSESAGDEEMVEDDSNDSEKPVKRVNKTPSQANIIRTAPYYLSLARDYSLALFKFYSFRLVNHVIQIGVEKLTEKELLVFNLISEFSLKKNLFESDSKLENSLKKLSNASMFDKLKCDLCDAVFCVRESSDLNKLYCSEGHLMNRCEKSLLPLNNFKFNKCSYCLSSWNYFTLDEYPHLNEFFLGNTNCLYCI